ncbi:MAG: glycosyltransferase family 4 protein [Elainellaceae cyanobacterium]
MNTELNVAFAPQFLDTNPYQKQLSEALLELKVNVQGISHHQVFLATNVKNLNTDILHLHWLHKYYRSSNFLKSILRTCKFISGLAILKYSGVRIVWTAHNLKDHENLFPLSDQVCSFAVALLSDAIISHSESARQELQKKLNKKIREKVFVVPHGNYIDYYENTISQGDARTNLNLPESAVIFLFFGLIRPYKGIPEMIRAFKKLNAKNAFLVIAGSSGDEELTQWIQKETENSEHIRFHHGFVPDEEVQIYMNACDVVVLPYRDSLTSGTLLLSMSFGRTCVAPSVGYIKEILCKESAFLYDPCSEEGLLEAMQSVVDNKPRCKAMGQSNLNLVKKLSWDKIATMTSKVYQHCLSK